MSDNNVIVKLGDLKVARQGATLVTVGLGSCVAIALYDPETRLGGLAHALLPSPSDSRHKTLPGRFAATAGPALLERMEAAGARRNRIHARLAGGAAMFGSLLSNGQISLGMRNVQAARGALEHRGILVRGQDVGGGHGRSIYFRMDDGRMLVTSVLQPDVVL